MRRARLPILLQGHASTRPAHITVSVQSWTKRTSWRGRFLGHRAMAGSDNWGADRKHQRGQSDDQAVFDHRRPAFVPAEGVNRCKLDHVGSIIFGARRGSQLFFPPSGRHKHLIPEAGKHLKFYSTPLLKGNSARIGAPTPTTMIWTMASPHPQRRRFFASTALRRSAAGIPQNLF